jgi:hypothetical protein
MVARVKGPAFKTPEEKDYKGATNYLSLICSDKDAVRYVKALRKAKTIERAAKDILRASGLRLLPRDNAQVAEDLAKIREGRPLAGVLLVRGDFERGVPLIVADGYHRSCALYYHAPDTMVPCRLVEW